MLMRCTENLKLPESHRIRLETCGIPGGTLVLFLPLNHSWATLEPGESYEFTLELHTKKTSLTQ